MRGCSNNGKGVVPALQGALLVYRAVRRWACHVADARFVRRKNEEPGEPPEMKRPARSAKQKAHRSEELCLPLPLPPKKGSFVLSSLSFLPSVPFLRQLRPSFLPFLPSFGTAALFHSYTCFANFNNLPIPEGAFSSTLWPRVDCVLVEQLHSHLELDT